MPSFQASQHAALPTTTLVLLLLWLLDPPSLQSPLTVGKRVARSDRRLFS